MISFHFCDKILLSYFFVAAWKSIKSALKNPEVQKASGKGSHHIVAVAGC
jgi:hypothetical protein